MRPGPRGFSSTTNATKQHVIGQQYLCTDSATLTTNATKQHVIGQQYLCTDSATLTTNATKQHVIGQQYLRTDSATLVAHQSFAPRNSQVGVQLRVGDHYGLEMEPSVSQS